MDSGETLSKALAEQQKKLQAIQQKLQELGCAHIDQLLVKTEYQPIQKALLQQPDLFLLLLDSPTFGLFLTENTREGFLKDLTENPDRLIASLIQSQKTPSEQVPELLQSSSESYADQEVDLVQEAFEQVTNFAAAYTPSMDNIRDTFGSFVEGLSCAVAGLTLDSEKPNDGTKHTSQPK